MGKGLERKEIGKVNYPGSITVTVGETVKRETRQLRSERGCSLIVVGRAVGEGMLIDCGGQGRRSFLTRETWRMLRGTATVTSGFRSGNFSASVWLL